MLKKFASDALGLSDIGIVVPKEDFDKTEADDFVLHESGEAIYFLIKTKADEYCFTNKALIHVDGENALSKKRLLKRYDYQHSTITEVMLETAGTIDLDIEIKFTINNIPMSIDIHKKFLSEIKDLYKALHAISVEMKNNAQYFEIAQNSLTYAAQSIGKTESNEVTPPQSFEQITRFATDWMLQNKKQYVKEDYSKVFELYINH
ncbi:PH domain-containing protein [Viridibacillus sp. YIM B01967]|uniref:PH domain-containing protein n=1 Tax=Viridibacillus soli TaxID=2798301 RepID=A0ABS1H9V2_9BACL|nr:PH domain-containing protein [Viridibacillus soli]MBK3495897.1 PH domain-containing protein [Viridibacillus soli]